MRILLDTNVLLWSCVASSRLDRSTRELLEDADNEVLFSAASIWEIAIKAGLGRADFQVDPDAILAAAHRSGFAALSITASVAVKAASLPTHHKDPFDRMLVAQAMAEPARLLTTDRTLLRYSELVTLIERRAE